jgi:hypothetical protein
MSYGTTVSESSFLVQSDGFVVGTFIDNPGLRYTLEGGVVGSSQTTPLYGGLPLTNTVTAPGSNGGGSSGLGETVVAATAESNIDSWCVFNQASAGIISGTSNVPLYYAGQSVNFVRQGSGLWIVLPVNPAAVNTIAGGASNQAIYWDYTNKRVDVTGTGALGFQIIALNSNSKTVTYSAGPPIVANWNGSGSVIVVRV